MKFMSKILIFLCSLLLSTIVGASISVVADLPFAATVTTLVVLSVLPQAPVGSLSAGLNKELWSAIYKDNFWAKTGYLNFFRDMTPWIEGSVVNLAVIGAPPIVRQGPSVTTPVATNDRTDIPVTKVMKWFWGENTKLPFDTLQHLAYDKVLSVVNQHRAAIIDKMARYGLYDLLPADSSEANAWVVAATGANNGGGFKRLTFADLIELDKKMNEANLPTSARYIILSPQHAADLIFENKELFNQIVAKGLGGNEIDNNGIFSFRVYMSNAVPKVEAADGDRINWADGTDAQVAGTTPVSASVAFNQEYTVRATAPVEIFQDLRNPTLRADIVGLQQLAGVGSMFGTGYKYSATIYSPAAA